LVLSGSNVVTAADQATGGTADPATGASGLEPQFVASDGGGPCFDFATGRYFSLTHSADFDFTTGFSLSGWIKRSVAGVGQHIFAQGNSGTEKLRALLTSGNSLLLQCESGGASGYVGCTYGAGLGWRHIAITYDGSLAAASRVAIYLDGTAQTAVVGTNFVPSLPAVNFERMGIYIDSSYQPFNSRMAWLGLWKRALTPVEVLAVMNYKRRT